VSDPKDTPPVEPAAETEDLPAAPDEAAAQQPAEAALEESPTPEPAPDEPEDLGALAEVDDDAVMAEFDHYKSLDEELAGDAQAEAAAGEGGDPKLTPKDRRLAAMRLEAKIEAIVFASQKPLRPQDILETLGDPTVTADDVQITLDQLVEFYEDRAGGFRLHYLKRLGYQFQTAEPAGPIMERMFASRPRPISRAALETLAIIAYRQPATRAEVEFIRGVDAGSIFKTLLERELIKCVGRKEIVGRPMLFGTTDQFLTVFNLSSIKDLPPLESFQPAREMVQGAMERLEDAADDLVDVEEYIADNTRGEYEGADPELLAEGAKPLPASADAEPKAASTVTRAGASAGPPGPAQNHEEADGTDADSEMAQPDGAGVPAGSRDLDH
jgi:segregation and condensation protein B